MKRIKYFISIVAIIALAMSLIVGCGSKEGVYKIINISDDKDFIESCPKEAKAGETVTVKISSVTDATSYVRVNEDPDFGSFIDYCTYVFIMPEEDVAVKAGFTTQGINAAEAPEEPAEDATGTGSDDSALAGTEGSEGSDDAAASEGSEGSDDAAASGTESSGTESSTGGGSTDESAADGGSTENSDIDNFATLDHNGGFLYDGDDFNILDGALESDFDDITYFYGNDFLLIMPNTDEWAYDQTDNNSITIYHVPSRESGFDGTLVTITAYDLDDNSYENHPHYQDAGIGVNAGKHFIATYPTDVRYDSDNSAQGESYRNLYDYLAKIGAGAVNSPFQTSDDD